MLTLYHVWVLVPPMARWVCGSVAAVGIVLQVAGLRTVTPEILAKSSMRLIMDVQMHAAYNLAMTAMGFGLMIMAIVSIH